MSIRTARVADEIQKVLGERLIRGLRDPLPGFVTIRGVEVTSDFTYAKVFVSVFGSDAQKQGAIAGLNQQRGALRHEVGQKIRLRNTPNLQFILDESSERAARVHALLDEVKQHDAQVAKRQAEQPAPAPAPAVEAPKPAAVVEAPKPTPVETNKPVVAPPNAVTTTATLSTKLERGASGSEGVRLNAEPTATPVVVATPAAPKAPAKKAATTKKVPAKKTTTKKAPAKKAPAKKATSKKAPAKKAPARKATSKKAPARKTPARKTTSKKAPAKKATSKKAPAKKTTAKKKKG